MFRQIPQHDFNAFEMTILKLESQKQEEITPDIKQQLQIQYKISIPVFDRPHNLTDSL